GGQRLLLRALPGPDAQRFASALERAPEQDLLPQRLDPGASEEEAARGYQLLLRLFPVLGPREPFRVAHVDEAQGLVDHQGDEEDGARRAGQESPADSQAARG